MDKQKVQIIFRAVNREPDSEETISLESPQCPWMESEARGEYCKKGDTHYCLYEEQPEGWDAPCRVMLKWKADILERHIRGEKASHMVFAPGKCHCNLYRTPYGNLLLETETRRLEITQGQDNFFILLEYSIKQDGQIVSENRMEIYIRGIGESI